MPDNTSDGATGATPPAPSPGATPTPASGSATLPGTPTLTVEELLKRNADLEHSHSNAKEELERHRKKLSAYEKQEKEAEAAKKAVEDAQKTELERIKEQHADSEARIKQLQQENIREKVINAAYKKGIVDPELAALALLQNKEGLDENGMPTDLDKALDTLIESKPYLRPETAATPAATPAQTAPTPQAPAVPAMHPSRAGRSDIPGAGSNPTGKPFTLDDYEWKR